MGKEDVIDYVMTTPGNPNRAVLSGMLDSIAESGGGTVEVSKIKLGTANGGGSTIASGVNSFGGGGTTVDSKTLAEVLGDKTIVSFELIVNGGIATAGECHVMPSGSGTMPVSILGISGKDAIASEDYTKYLTVNGIVNFGITGSATIDIYAICI